MEINLKEAVRRLESANEDLSKITEDEDLMEFASRATELGCGILGQLPKNELLGAVTLIEAQVLADLLMEGEIETALFLASHIEEFAVITTVALRTAVGLAVMEEWH